MKKEECDARMEKLLKEVASSFMLKTRLGKGATVEYPEKVVAYIELCVKSALFREIFND